MDVGGWMLAFALLIVIVIGVLACLPGNRVRDDEPETDYGDDNVIPVRFRKYEGQE